MIILKDYGVELNQLSADKVELVRQWRNSPRIQQFMEYRDVISPEAQQKWYKKIVNSGNDFYFIINYDCHDIGLINIKDIDWNKRVGESGIFIYDDRYLGKGISYRAALCQRDFAFDVLHLDNLIVHIYKTNYRSIRYNKRFGFMLSEENDINSQDEVKQKYILSKASYYSNKAGIIQMLNERYI